MQKETIEIINYLCYTLWVNKNPEGSSGLFSFPLFKKEGNEKSFVYCVSCGIYI